MARFLPSALVTDARGAASGIAFSHGRSGAVARSKISASQRDSPYQRAQRQAMQLAAIRWRETLTAAQRAAWAAYASTVPRLDVFGHAKSPSGRGCYIAYNSFAYRNLYTAVDAAPIALGEARSVRPGLAGSDAGGVILGVWYQAPPTNSRIQILQCKNPVSRARESFSGPWTLNRVIPGGSALPITLISSSVTVIGQRWYFAFRTYETSGRLSIQTIFSVDIAA